MVNKTSNSNAQFLLTVLSLLPPRYPVHNLLSIQQLIFKGLYDKGKAALVTIDAITKNEKGEEVISYDSHVIDN